MKNLVLPLLFLLCFSSCSKHKSDYDSPAAQAHIYKGIMVTDDVGMELGTWGTEDGDWGMDASWTTGEYSILNFTDTVSLDGTYIRDTTGWNTGTGIHEQPRNLVAVYPNPATYNQVLVFRGLGLLKFKAAIVDKYYNRLYTCVCKDSLADFQFDFSDTLKYQNGKLYRLYYTLSTKDNPNFHKGHGDILICRNHALLDCKSYVP